MSQNQLRRAVFAVLLLGLSVASFPAQAWPPVRGKAPVVADLGEGPGLLGKLWELVAGLLGVQEKEGVTIDPDGATGDEGVLIDPNGAK